MSGPQASAAAAASSASARMRCRLALAAFHSAELPAQPGLVFRLCCISISRDSVPAALSQLFTGRAAQLKKRRAQLAPYAHDCSLAAAATKPHTTPAVKSGCQDAPRCRSIELRVFVALQLGCDAGSHVLSVAQQLLCIRLEGCVDLAEDRQEGDLVWIPAPAAGHM